MSQTNLENLKRLIAEGKRKNPKKPVYSESIKKGILSLLSTMSTKEIANETGASLSLVGNIKRSASKKSLSLKSDRSGKEASHLHFLQIPSEIPHDKKEKIDGPKRFMKVTIPSGIIIEIWGE